MTFRPGLALGSCPPEVYVGPGPGGLALRPTAIRTATLDLRCKSSLQHPHAKVQHVDVAVIGAGKLQPDCHMRAVMLMYMRTHMLEDSPVAVQCRYHRPVHHKAIAGAARQPFGCTHRAPAALCRSHWCRCFLCASCTALMQHCSHSSAADSSGILSTHFL